MPLEKKLVREKLLVKFGFEIIPGHDHDRLAFFYDGLMIANTSFSRNSKKDIDDGLLKLIAGEIRISRLGFFKNMINCSKSKEDYINELKNNGSIK